MILNRGQRSSGLLQQICDRLRDGEQTLNDLDKLTCRQRKCRTFRTHFTLHYDNESCSFTNMRQLCSECNESSPQKRMICKASCHTTNDNHSVVDGLVTLPAKKFNFTADILCVAVGCDIRLIKDLDVAAGLVDSTTGTVVNVIHDNADCSALIAGKKPSAVLLCHEFLRVLYRKQTQVTGFIHLLSSLPACQFIGRNLLQVAAICHPGLSGSRR